MSTCADAKTGPLTKEYEDGYDRIFGKKEPERGRWIQDPKTGTLVPAHEYVPEARYSVGDGIASGRFYENTAIRTDTNAVRDVGSRKRYREYLKETGTTHASDYTQFWKQAAEKREAVKAGKLPSKSRRETIERAFHKLRGY